MSLVRETRESAGDKVDGVGKKLSILKYHACLPATVFTEADIGYPNGVNS